MSAHLGGTSLPQLPSRPDTSIREVIVSRQLTGDEHPTTIPSITRYKNVTNVYPNLRRVTLEWYNSGLVKAAFETLFDGSRVDELVIKDTSERDFDGLEALGAWQNRLQLLHVHVPLPADCLSILLPNVSKLCDFEIWLGGDIEEEHLADITKLGQLKTLSIKDGGPADLPYANLFPLRRTFCASLAQMTSLTDLSLHQFQGFDNVDLLQLSKLTALTRVAFQDDRGAPADHLVPGGVLDAWSVSWCNLKVLELADLWMTGPGAQLEPYVFGKLQQVKLRFSDIGLDKLEAVLGALPLLPHLTLLHISVDAPMVDAPGPSHNEYTDSDGETYVEPQPTLSQPNHLLAMAARQAATLRDLQLPVGVGSDWPLLAELRHLTRLKLDSDGAYVALLPAEALDEAVPIWAHTLQTLELYDVAPGPGGQRAQPGKQLTSLTSLKLVVAAEYDEFTSGFYTRLLPAPHLQELDIDCPVDVLWPAVLRNMAATSTLTSLQVPFTAKMDYAQLRSLAALTLLHLHGAPFNDLPPVMPASTIEALATSLLNLEELSLKQVQPPPLIHPIRDAFPGLMRFELDCGKAADDVDDVTRLMSALLPMQSLQALTLAWNYLDTRPVAAPLLSYVLRQTMLEELQLPHITDPPKGKLELVQLARLKELRVLVLSAQQQLDAESLMLALPKCLITQM